jgi:hypothetical protein
MEPTIDRAAGPGAGDELMARLALVRLRRFERVAAVAEESGSRLWRDLARRAARAAYRDCLLLGLANADGVTRDTAPGQSRAA